MKKPNELLFELVGLGPIKECETIMQWVEGGRIDNSGYQEYIRLKGQHGEGTFNVETIEKYFDYRLKRGSLMQVKGFYEVQVEDWNKYELTHGEELKEIERLKAELATATSRL